jgi:hypothetical protein
MCENGGRRIMSLNPDKKVNFAECWVGGRRGSQC